MICCFEESMAAGKGELTENELAHIVMDEAFKIHRSLGPGLLESVYEVILLKKLTDAGLHTERQFPIAIHYEGVAFEEGFRADLMVEQKLMVEVKSIDSLHPVHYKQVLTYLRLTGCRLGLLINFGEAYLKHGFKRVVNGLPDDQD